MALGFFLSIRVARLQRHATYSRRLAPSLNSTAFPQREVLEDKLAFAAWEWSAAGTTGDLATNGLGPGFLSDKLIQRIAVRTDERRLDGGCHDTPPRADRFW
jgi:hypothetical protein